MSSAAPLAVAREHELHQLEVLLEVRRATGAAAAQRLQALAPVAVGAVPQEVEGRRQQGLCAASQIVAWKRR